MQIAKFIACIICLLYIDFCYSLSISGVVIDSLTEQPVVGAECALINRGDCIAQCLTSSLGKYELTTESICFGDSLILRIKHLEYEDCETDVNFDSDRTELDSIYLNKVTIFDDLVITADFVRDQNGSLLYTPTVSQIQISPFATDLIGNLSIPGVVYNSYSKSITIPGRNPIFLMNGVKTSQQVLSTIKATDVLSVEYSDVVPPIYSNEGDCLIYVRTRKISKGATFFIGNINDFKGLVETSSLNASLNLGNSNIRISNDFNYERHPKTYDNQYQEYVNPAHDVLSSYSNTHAPFNYKTNSSEIEYTYNPNSTFIINSKIRLNLYNSLRKESASICDTQIGDYKSWKRSHWNNLNPSFDLYLLKSFNETSKIDFSIVGNFTHNDYVSSLNYSDNVNISIPEYSLTSKRQAIIPAVSFSQSFNDNSKIIINANGIFSRNHNVYKNGTDNYFINENHLCFSAGYEKTFKNIWIHLQSGILYKRLTENNFSHKKILNQTFINSTLSISRNISLRYRGEYSPQPISISDLIDYTIYTSNYLYEIGNPNLKYTKNLQNALDLLFSFGDFRVNYNINYLHQFNPRLLHVSYNPLKDLYFRQPINGNYINKLENKIDIGIAGVLNMFSFKGGVQYSRFGLKAANWNKTYHNFGGWFNITWQYKKWMALYSREFPIKTLNGYQYSTEPSFDTFAIQFLPNDNWTIGISWDYMFKKSGWDTKTEINSPYYICSWSRQMRDTSNLVRLSFTYTFTSGDRYNQTLQHQHELKDVQSTFKRVDQ